MIWPKLKWGLGKYWTTKGNTARPLNTILKPRRFALNWSMFCDGHSDFRLLPLFERLALYFHKGSDLLGGHPRIKRSEGAREIIMRCRQVRADVRGFRIVFKGLAVLPFVVQYFPKPHFSFGHIIMQPHSLGIMILRSREVLIRFSRITERPESLSRF